MARVGDSSLQGQARLFQFRVTLMNGGIGASPETTQSAIMLLLWLCLGISNPHLPTWTVPGVVVCQRCPGVETTTLRTTIGGQQAGSSCIPIRC